MRRKDWTAALAVVIAINGASAAAAAPVEDEFVSICLQSDTIADATARARAAGFVTPPAELRERIKGFQNADMLWRADEGEVMLFMAMTLAQGKANPAGFSMNGDACAVGAMPSQRDLAAKIEQLLNVGAAQPFGKNSGYIFEKTANGPVRLDASDRALIRAKMADGSVRIVSTIERSGTSALMQLTARVNAH